MYSFLLIDCHEIGINTKLAVTKRGINAPSRPPTQPALYSSSCLLSDWLLINVSAITGPWDWRESPVHASLPFMNGSKTGVRLRVFMCSTMACDSKLQTHRLRGGGAGADIKEAVRGGRRDNSTVSCVF